ncbi:hypothetical protein DICPUDRAFT_81541 [Dictyostelium purpureum]|uniref:DDE Tnp4 domain-containing protein n=1 Tax=Dictyostelium purpureum TaxID=5786 RepID=F0ZTT3_DICPU|nr:uncharacterized protein DICPUDRAFT_81541 [Dictyostelium purpureum]EGC32648.1 hypothetical protein DICPUDRAFT_81541 [Dictyostelium purpureum]|eukprot:XP_003290817.1 hypothetical protein DICPUDRAFT_81541 [Dictyostelium purpureum]
MYINNCISRYRSLIERAWCQLEKWKILEKYRLMWTEDQSVVEVCEKHNQIMFIIASIYNIFNKPLGEPSSLPSVYSGIYCISGQEIKQDGIVERKTTSGGNHIIFMSIKGRNAINPDNITFSFYQLYSKFKLEVENYLYRYPFLYHLEDLKKKDKSG